MSSGSRSFLEQKRVVGPFQCNCHILACPRTGDALVVDPGDEPSKLLRAVEEMKTPSGQSIRVKYLLHTHAHLDHIGATRKLKEAWGTEGAQIALHRGDEEIYLNLQKQGQLFGLQYDAPLPIDEFLEDGRLLEVGDLRLEVIHTPGHSPGGVCFRLKEDASLGVQGRVFSGDTLFQGSVGRTDLWGADQEQMFRSIRERLFSLEDDLPVCPGHGPDTRIGVEKRENPFVGEGSTRRYFT